MFSNVLTSSFGAALLLSDAPAPKGFMDSLPDPMKLDVGALLFVMVLITFLFVFLKYTFFKPVIQVMDDREAAIQSGAASRTEAASMVERRQAEYAARLKELRGQAFEHRKTLAAAAVAEKVALLGQAHAASAARRAQALAELQVAKESAKAELLAQVDRLSESMVQHLLQQA